MILRIFTLLLLTVFLASCGSKKGTVPVKLKILQGYTTANSVTLSGGVLIMGKSEDGANSFRVGVPSSNSDLTLDLAKGRWEFAAVGWAGGAGILSGTNTCAYTGYVDLKDNDSSVTFNFTKARCADTFNGRVFSEHLNSSVTGQFLQLYPVPCYQASGSTMNSTNCPTAPSVGDRPSSLGSYKVIYEGEQKGNVSGFASALVSQCFAVFGGTYPYVPMTSTSTDSPLGFSLQFFPDNSCAGVPVTYNFKNGALSNNLSMPNTFTPYGTYYSYFFFNPGAAFDIRVPNSASSSLNIPSAIFHNSSDYVNNNSVTLAIGTHPVAAFEMCLTETTCSAGDWVALSNSATFNLSAGDGAKTIKLFHRNLAGVASSTNASYLVQLVTTPMMASTPSVSSQAGYLTLNWIGASIVDDLVATTRLRVCSDNTCSVPYFDGPVPTPSSGSIQILPGQLITTMPIGSTYYAKLEVIDIFGMPTYLSWTSFATTYELVKP